MDIIPNDRSATNTPRRPTARALSIFLLTFAINSLSVGVLFLGFTPVSGTPAAVFTLLALPFIGIAVTSWASRKIRVSNVVAARVLLATGLLPGIVIFVLLLNLFS